METPSDPVDEEKTLDNPPDQAGEIEAKPAHERLDLSPDEFPFDRYEPETIIGKGSVGTIYLSRDRRLHRKKVAVKVLKAVSDAELVSFHQEARATSRLSHRNIIAVFDFGATEGGVPFMAMEYVNGISLDRLLRREGALDQDMALKIAVSLADALAYAHSRGIFHRDIKTSNILLLDDEAKGPDVRLIDFGVAQIRLSAEESIKVQGRTIVGTPQYMSPDQAYNLIYDERSEIYSLGCVLFEMLTGRPPFQGDTALQIIAMHANEPPPTLTAAHGGFIFSNAIETIMARCLAKNRDERFPSMFALKNEIERIIDRDYSITLDRMPADPVTTNSHDRDPMLSAIMIALVCFGLASWMAYLHFERILTSKSISSSVNSSAQRKVDLTLPSLDEYRPADQGFMRTYNYGRLVIQGNHIKDEDLKTLSTERNINELKLNAPDLTGAGFRSLSNGGLLRLIIRQGTLSDECLATISTLGSIKHLEFVGCDGITARGIKSLSALNLDHLGLIDCNLNDGDLKMVAAIKPLKVLDFSGNGKISAETLDAIRKSTKLQSLALSSEQPDARCYETIAGTSSLTALEFRGNKVIDARDLFCLTKLPALERLKFADKCLSAADCNVLTKCSPLSKLEFYGPNYGDQHLSQLDGLKARQMLFVDCKLTDSGLAHLARMPNLERVNLKNCPSVTTQAVSEISKRLPSCDIVVL